MLANIAQHFAHNAILFFIKQDICLFWHNDTSNLLYVLLCVWTLIWLWHKLLVGLSIVIKKLHSLSVLWGFGSFI